MEYNFREIEKKWQDKWAKDKTFKTEESSAKPKYYVLDMFPYPSGAGLHVGHPLGYIASDILARYKRLKGFNVLHPMGYDSFGLPAEQYAIQTGQHPAITTEQNIKRYREQLDKIGFSFDWDREVRTSDPAYYKWTQWIFIQLFHSWYNPRTNKAEKIDELIKIFETEGSQKITSESLSFVNPAFDAFNPADWASYDEKKRSDILMNFRIAYLGEAFVNWCPTLGTVLANDEVKDGVSERGGYPVERKLMKQWSMRITAYAQRLLDGLDKIDWSESLRESQRNWIGRSEGSGLKFRITSNSSPKERRTDSGSPGYHTAKKQLWAALKDRSRENRKEPTEAESILWERVRDNRLGFKIRMQHAIEQFIADFVCLEKKLIIEIDGKIHETQKDQDTIRTFILEDTGYKVIRFTNDEVINKTDFVCNEIKKVLSFGEDLGEAFIEVFTTRPDTIFGVSFITLAPEHELVDKITTPDRKKAIDEYITFAKNRSERERMADVKKITGEFTGAYVEHPFTGKPIPVWVGDYVLAGYGTGAVMAVPAHDSRDYAFAKHFNLPIIQVVEAPDSFSFGEGRDEAYDAKEGKLINSDFLNGLDVKDAVKRAIQEIEKLGLGKGKINYRLRDAVFGRQRYWGEPIPVFYKDGIAHTIPENELPLVLPEVDKFLPTESGEPPLARAKNWKYRGKYDYEHTTMPGWAGSSWYYLRYMDADNDKEFVSKQAADYWQNIDLYLGGSEHATGHLLYVRFWTMFLRDMGYINIDEPAKKLINQGMIQGVSAFVYGFGVGVKFGLNQNEGKGMPNLEKFIVPKSSYDNFNKNGEDSLLRRIINEQLQKLTKEGFVAIEQSKELTSLIPIHVDISMVDSITNELAVEAFEKSDRYKSLLINKIFREENEKYITGREVEKMSKSKYNVVSPDSICEQYGADCLRLYEMFLGPLEQSKPWNTNGITGVSGFIKKLWRLFHSPEWNNTPLQRRGTGGEAISDDAPTKPELKTLHKTIKKIHDDIERFSFNTSVSNFMICVNELTEQKCNKRSILEPLTILIAPYAPHIAEELWSLLGHKESITYAKFPDYKEEYMMDDSFAYPVSFNGKTRFKLELPLSMGIQEIEKEVLSSEEAIKYLEGKTPKKVIIVPKKIVNIVM